MQNKEPVLDDGEVEYEAGPESAWGNFEDDDDVMQQQSSIQDDEAKKFPFVGDKVRPYIVWTLCNCFLHYLVI